MTAKHTGDTIDDAVLDGLRPQQRRYDVVVDDQLVLSVLPNGVKTWTWVHDDPSDPHRKTLGIYPDMTLDDARKSLTTERAAYRRASEEVSPAFVIRDGRIEPVTKQPSRLPLFAAAGAAVVVAAVVIGFLLPGDKDPDASTSNETLFRPTDESTAPIRLPSVPPGDITLSDNATSGTTDEPLRPTVQRADDRAMAAVSVGQLDDRLSSLEPANMKPPSEPLPGPMPQPTGMTTSQVRDTTSAPAPSQPAANAVATPPAAVAQVQDETPASVIGTRPINEPGNELILDGRVARGQLTTSVQQREPVDDLGTYIIGNGDELQTYFFFTELRELAGQRARHRWVQNGRIVAEIPFNVGEAWRWRVYSSKTFIPSMSGPWQVQVLLDDDTVIYNLPFEFTP